MKIGVIGIRNVGSALGRGWLKTGHQVMFGVRDISDPKVKELLTIGGVSAAAGTTKEAAAFSEVLVLSVPWSAARSVIEDAGNLSGKIVLDVTNPLAPDLSGLVVGHETSAGEMVAGWAIGAFVVKIFNTTGASNMENPIFHGCSLTMPYCGDDQEAKATAAKLAEDIGFSPIDVGPLKQARLLEPLAMLWISMAYGGYGQAFAFQMIKRQP